jgi:hypothetical protein
MELAVIGALAGIALGLRYKVLMLMPAVTLATIFTIMVGVARADSFWSIVLTTVAVVTAFQLGYLAGIVIRAAIEEIFPPRNGNGDSGPSLGMPLDGPATSAFCCVNLPLPSARCAALSLARVAARIPARRETQHVLAGPSSFLG